MLFFIKRRYLSRKIIGSETSPVFKDFQNVRCRKNFSRMIRRPKKIKSVDLVSTNIHLDRVFGPKRLEHLIEENELDSDAYDFGVL